MLWLFSTLPTLTIYFNWYCLSDKFLNTNIISSTLPRLSNFPTLLLCCLYFLFAINCINLVHFCYTLKVNVKVIVEVMVECIQIPPLLTSPLGEVIDTVPIWQSCPTPDQYQGAWRASTLIFNYHMMPLLAQSTSCSIFIRTCTESKPSWGNIPWVRIPFFWNYYMDMCPVSYTPPIPLDSTWGYMTAFLGSWENLLTLHPEIK